MYILKAGAGRHHPVLPLPSGCRAGVPGQRRGWHIPTLLSHSFGVLKNWPSRGFQHPPQPAQLRRWQQPPSCGCAITAWVPCPQSFGGSGVAQGASRGVGAQGSAPLGLFPKQGGMLPRRREVVPKQLLKWADDVVIDIVRFARQSGSLFKISPAVPSARLPVRGHISATGATAPLSVVTGEGRCECRGRGGGRV